jgi:hypothetical protein
MLSDDPDVRAVIDAIQINPEATMTPADQVNLDDPDGNTTDIDDGPQNAYNSDERTRSDQFEDLDSMATLRRAAGLPVQEGAMKEIDIGRQDCKSMSDAEFEQAYKMTKKEWRTKYADVLKESVLTDDTGSTLEHILNTFRRDVKDFKAGGEMSRELHDALFDYYFDDMPYGVQKARTGDPYEWVADRFGADLGLPGYGLNSPGIGPEDDPSVEREGVDYATEDDLADVTSIGGDASDRLMADVMTNQQGTDINEEGLPEERLCNMTEAGEMCPVHGLEECWGATAPAVPVAKELDPMLSRMRTLAGFMVK